MKIFLYSSAALLLFSILCNTLKAQLPAITSLTIIPENPSTQDIVKVVSQSMFPSGGCDLTASNISTNAGIIDVYATHTLGMLTYICSSSDTLSLGMLESGNYKLRYHLSCMPYSLNTDLDSVDFTVQTYTGFAMNRNIQHFTLFPNPARDKVNIQFPDISSTAKITFYDLPGKVQLSLQTSEIQTTIDVNGLSKGIYIMKVQSADRTGFQKFIKQ